MFKSLIILLVLFLQLIIVNIAQSKDSRGRDFVVTFLPNYHQNAIYPNQESLESHDSLSIYVTGPEGTTGNINFRDYAGMSFNQPFQIPASGAYLYQLYWLNYELQGFLQFGVNNIYKQNNQIASQSFRVTSDNDVSVYALNKTYKSSDATIVFPVDVLGKEYVVASYNSNEPNYPDTAGVMQNKFTPSEFAVVATEDNTHIDFVLTADAYANGKIPFSKDLNAGDVFLVQANYSDNRTYGDLTGSYIKADKPIALFGGHQRALIPNSYSGQLSSRDQLYEQMLPIESLGKMYLITPLAKPSDDQGYAYDIYRIIAAYDSTAIFVDGNLKGIYKKGKFYEGKLDTACIITASRNVMAVEYKKSSSLTSYNGTIARTYKGDPFMLIVPPKKQYLTDYITYNIQAQEYDGYMCNDIYDDQYVTVIAPTAYITSTTMDAVPLDPRFFTPIGNTCYSYASFPVEIGAHKFKGIKPFGVYVYAYGGADSYGYNGGMNFQSINEIIPEVKGDAEICLGDSTKLTAEGCVEIYWTPQNTLDNPNIKTPIAFPKKTTWYKAYMTDSLGCVYTDSVKVTVVPSALVDAGPDTTICLGNSTVLRPSGAVDYVWDKNPTLSCTNCENPTATPTNSSWYYVTAKDINGCGGRDSVHVNILPSPVIDAGKDTVFCLGNSLELRPSGGNYYTWNYDESLSCSECDNPVATPTKKTTYYVTGYNSFGCLARDSITLNVFPSILISAGRDTSVCFGTRLFLEAKGGLKYLWDDNPSLSCLNCANPTASPIKDEIYYVSGVDSNGCIGRDSIKVHVYPDFTLNVSNDTTVCTGQKAVLSAKGAYKYHWEPADKVLCDSCDITESTVDKDITFYLTAENENGCQKQDSIHVKAVNCDIGVDDVVYPLDVYCYDESKPCFVNNTGELPIRLDTLILDGPDKNNFSIVHTGRYPLSIPKGEKYQFNVEFHPDGKSTYSSLISVHSNLEKIDTIHINAEKRIANLKLSATMQGGSHPGDTCLINLNIQSDDWARLHVKYLDIKLQYKYFKFAAEEKQFILCGDMPANWNITAKEEHDTDNQLDIWNINLSGGDELKANTCLTLMKPVYMLHTNVFYDIEISGAVPAYEICTQVEGTKANILLNYCVDSMRAVTIGMGQFGYEIPNQICSKELKSEVHLPFAADVDISIIDILGQENNISKGRLDQGYTKLNSDISNYPAGTYFICFKSGQVIITKKIIINTN